MLFAALLGLALPVAAAQHAAKHHAGVISQLSVKSAAALVLDQNAQQILYAKNIDDVMPIASLTKLMNAMVVLESGASLDERITVTAEDVDDLKHTRSRLKVGTVLTRGELLKLALMASENRAAAALARSYPGSTPAFVAAMNLKARELGMQKTRYVDGTGLSSENVSTARDLARLAAAAYRQPLIREHTTDTEHTVELANGRRLQYSNSNRLVKNSDWHIGMSKTGFINEAGRCLIMQAGIGSTPVIIVLLDSWGKLTRIGDANRIKKWMESQASRRPAG